ncbi:unnamed protein product [Sphenostylis stenocarpa]|uniref:COBRA-like protein 7 n=1 Tax=Sphenostylis stenocarpa TaxID=92480 RepID=A0AA86T1P4_9FABA|nr:unnamed protein product [Sphenostylis stenocarpa]
MSISKHTGHNAITKQKWSKLKSATMGPKHMAYLPFFSYHSLSSQFLAMSMHVHVFFLFLTVAIFSGTPSMSQSQTAASCNGIFVSYVYTGGERLPPNLSNVTEQPYRFESTLTVLNNGLEELKSWKVFVGFQHSEWLVSASNAVLADGTSLPSAVGNGTIFSGSTVRDLKTAVATAGDLNQMQIQVEMVGSLLGVAPPSVPMPRSVTLSNDGFVCGQPSGEGRYIHLLLCFISILSAKHGLL